MNTVFKNKRIAGILGILPETVCLFEDEMKDGNSVRSQKIKKNMGYGKRYRAKKNTTVSQLCSAGLKYLLEQGIVSNEEIGGIIVCSLSPDYYVPQISNLIQAECELSSDVFAMDMWTGCSGYLEGLFQGLMLLERIEDKKVLVFTGDTLCRLNDEPEVYDNPPYGGDGASITILENTEENCEIPFVFRNDGKGKNLIAFWQGAFADMFHKDDKIKDGVNLNPTESFLYFQKCIPALFEEFYSKYNMSKEQIDFFCFIQANRLSVQKFADKLGLPYEKVALDLVAKYGDLSATLNPVGIVDWYGEALCKNTNQKVAICGYGAGAKWGLTVLDLGQLRICKNIVCDK